MEYKGWARFMMAGFCGWFLVTLQLFSSSSSSYRNTSRLAQGNADYRFQSDIPASAGLGGIVCAC
jgi:hypothetical protein